MAKKGSVLVVDDEEIMRDVLETLLSAEGYRVDLAKTGEEGLECYGRRAYDVVLLRHLLDERQFIDRLRVVCNGAVRVNGNRDRPHAEKTEGDESEGED